VKLKKEMVGKLKKNNRIKKRIKKHHLKKKNQAKSGEPPKQGIVSKTHNP
jgi:hypothetical protein